MINTIKPNIFLKIIHYMWSNNCLLYLYIIDWNMTVSTWQRPLLAEKMFVNYSRPDIPELNAVDVFVHVDACNIGQLKRKYQEFWQSKRIVGYWFQPTNLTMWLLGSRSKRENLTRHANMERLLKWTKIQ